MIRVTLSPYYLKKCIKFAEQSAGTHFTHYKARGQTSQEKIKSDIICGKLGEVAVEQYLGKLGECSKPDFNIYTGRRKSFNVDLLFNSDAVTHGVHVKSQTMESVKKYGVSCLFQYDGYGKGHTDKVFKVCDEDEILALCTVDGLNVTIHGIWRMRELLERGLFEEPKLQWFKDTKKAIYLSSVERSEIENLICSSLAI